MLMNGASRAPQNIRRRRRLTNSAHRPVSTGLQTSGGGGAATHFQLPTNGQISLIVYCVTVGPVFLGIYDYVDRHYLT